MIELRAFTLTAIAPVNILLNIYINEIVSKQMKT